MLVIEREKNKCRSGKPRCNLLWIVNGVISKYKRFNSAKGPNPEDIANFVNGLTFRPNVGGIISVPDYLL